MTTENQEVQEVIEENQIEETQEETQEITESADNPPEEGEAESENSEVDEKENARKGFWERQNKYKEQAGEAERLRRENEYLRQQALQAQQQERQQYKDPNEPDLDVYLDNGKSAQEWSRDHRIYLDNLDRQQRSREKLSGDYSSKMKEYSEQSKDIYEYEQAVTRSLGNRSDIAQVIMRSEKAPQLVEALALKPELVDDLMYARDHYELARKIVEIESSVSKKPVFSDAPTPKSQRKGEPVQSTQVDISKMSTAEYRKFRNSQRR